MPAPAPPVDSPAPLSFVLMRWYAVLPVLALLIALVLVFLPR